MTLAKLTLLSGREIQLSEAHLVSTYGGLLEGYPSRRLNDALLASMVERATRLMPRAPVWVIPPTRTPATELATGSMPFGPAELLPAVIVTARFLSKPVHSGADPVLEYSRLTVAWFQADTELPRSGRAPDFLNNLDWESLAEDEEI